jgi:sulfide:quinone oxidoreductase
MDIRNITDDFSVSPQIAEADLAAVREEGFRSIICNRPDGEEAGQPVFFELAGKAQELGMETLSIPIRGAPVAEADVAAFRRALADLPKPILAYCRTGTRSAILWSLAQENEMSLEEIISATSRAGYDVAPVLHAAIGSSGPSATSTGAKR